MLRSSTGSYPNSFLPYWTEQQNPLYPPYQEIVAYSPGYSTDHRFSQLQACAIVSISIIFFGISTFIM